MSAFNKFTDAVRAQFDTMKGSDLFYVDVERDEIWDVYLKAFPEGTDPVFRTRTEHDCACCRHFIRDAGAIVTINADLTLTTIWDVADLPHPYDVVARALAEHVRKKAIENRFMHSTGIVGTKISREIIAGKVHSWNHFFLELPASAIATDIPSRKSRITSAVGVFKRGLEEISIGAVDTVLDLINANALYRGETVKGNLSVFRAHLEAYRKINDPDTRDKYVWRNSAGAVSTIRNTSIGELLLNLSANMDMEVAVGKYEAMVAPTNYRRTTALITPRMVDDALKTIRGMGIEGAVYRRHAKIDDVSVNDVLFVDNAVRGQMKDGLADLLMEASTRPPVDIAKRNPKKMFVDDFVKEVIPRAKTLDVVLETKNRDNFVTLTAPVQPDTGSLFNWDNDFAWAYSGDVTDSLKQKVKTAGGDVDAALRVSLGWYCDDDLDLHCYMPDYDHIYFGNKAGILDIDMNAGGRVNNTDPVENMRWKRMPPDGTYEFRVDNFCRRRAVPGFDIEVECDGELFQYHYDKVCGRSMPCLRITILKGKLTKVVAEKGLTGGHAGGRVVEKWGISTHTPIPVDSVMFSPNHWGENAAGQKHLMFMLRGCKNPEPVRGIFPEYLRPELQKHRKVFEVLGSKTKAQPVDDQLSGVGFTQGRNDSVTVIVNGGETFEIQF